MIAKIKLTVGNRTYQPGEVIDADMSEAEQRFLLREGYAETFHVKEAMEAAGKSSESGKAVEDAEKAAESGKAEEDAGKTTAKKKTGGQ